MTDENKSFTPTTDQIKYPDTAEKVEELKRKLGLVKDTDLLSVSLSLLNMCVQLQEQGYEISAIKDNGLLIGREVRKIHINVAN